MINIRTYNIVLSFVVFGMIGGFMNAQPANASSCSTYVTCNDISDFHDDTRDAINDFVDDIIDNYEKWIENTFWEDGIALALPDMMEQLTMAQMKKTEIHATAVHSQDENDAMRTIQRGRVDNANSVQPSEEHCKFATLAGGVVAALDSGKSVLIQSMSLMRQVATGSSPAMVDRSLFTQVQKEEALCKYASRDAAGGAIDALCTGPVPTDRDQERALVGNFSTKLTLDTDDQIALNAHTQSMFLSNRPTLLNPELLNNDNTKMAYMEHRSVLSREMLASNCFLK
ncbi:MAG: hypothetical protein JKY11_00795, partial [Alphaproteobacteria bacterium]|nr:hypothetical protein [Alphaproteobacteria bacterium]